MVTFTPVSIQTNILPTTKFSEYRNKIQTAMDEFGTSINTELANMFDVLSTETTYTKAQIDTIIADLYTKEEIAGAIGNINSPLLDLSLQSSLSMKAGVGSVTFSRSTTATYIDRYGVLKTAAVDEPRFEKDGLLIEGSNTNISLYSEDSTKWGSYHSSVAVDSTVINPYNLLGTPKIVGDTGEFEHYTERVDSITSSTDTYTVSLFIKKGTKDVVRFSSYFTGGTNVARHTFITFSTETATNGAKLEKLSNDWYRVSLQITDNDSGNNAIRWRVYPNNGSKVDTSNDYIYAFGGQIEKLHFVTSYIPTTDSAVTRGTDVCKVTAEGNVTSNDADVTYSMSVSALGNTTASQAFFEKGNGVYNLARVGATGKFEVYTNGGSIGVNEAVYNTTRNIAVSYSPVGSLIDTKFYVDGTLIDSISTAYFHQNASPFSISIGSRYNNTDLLHGHIKNFKIYDKALTVTEIALLGGK